jgi:hypothetical protein
MTIYVFTGPTLSADEARAELDAVYLPPVAQGDVYRATLGRPEAIGIIDGYFERIPSVWHKEILYALSQGIHVFGSSSMGALRAAELEPFGMVGVGAIFEAFQSGALEDDDEVAVAHGSPEDGYRALSEAMVNIRATLDAAGAAGAIGRAARDAFVRIAKDLYYPERSYAMLLQRAAEEGIAPADVDALRTFVSGGRINRKRDDAIAMLRAMREHLAAEPGPRAVSFSFEHTDTWEEVRRRAGRLPLGFDAGEGELLEEVLIEEVQIAGGFVEARYGAMVRALALEEAQRSARRASPDLLRGTVDAIRARHALLGPQDFNGWLDQQRITDDELVGFVEEEAHVRWFEAMFEPDVARNLANHLRATGAYGDLVARALDKRRALAARGLAQGVSLDDTRMTEPEVWRWYFEERLGRPVPADVERYATATGFADVDALRRAVLRELSYVRSQASAGE